MKKLRGVALLIIVAFACFFDFKSACAAGPTLVNNFALYEPTVWKKENSPYIVRHALIIKKTLTIEPGVVVKFDFAWKGGFFVEGSLIAIGTENEKIVFTSSNDDAFGGDSNGNGLATTPKPGDWSNVMISTVGSATLEHTIFAYGSERPSTGNIVILSSATSSLKNSEIKYGLYAGIYLNRGTQPIIENNIISNNGVGVDMADYSSGKTVTISNNVIVDNGKGASMHFLPPWKRGIFLDARNNWWGDKSGPYYKHVNYGEDNLDGQGNSVGDGILFDPWLKKDPNVEDVGCQENCHSNIMFLPGIKASRLYKKDEGEMEDQVWPPNYLGNDLTNLALYKDGKSVNQIYTRDAVDEIGIPLVGGNIYKTFLDKLAELKTENVINDYQSFGYDWRQNVEDIVENGTPYPDGEIKSAVSDIITLAESSKSEKVTIIAHSNGGLLAKAIMRELENRGMADKVDKLVLIGTPQMGTPTAILSMLNGYDESVLLGTLISRSQSRDLAENMPGAYGLLPSEKYFERMEEPFINFSSLQTRYKDFAAAYGENIDSIEEFKNFLLGKIDGREKPQSEDVEKENILNESLLNQSLKTHENLDNWTPPADVEVIQIAGWGLDTISGVNYAEKEDVQCYAADSKIPSCIGMGTYEPIYEPKFTVDGDKTVVAPSALMLPVAENVKKYWLDLWSENKGISINRQHKDIFEVSPIRQFIENIFTDNYLNTPLPKNIQINRPSPEGYDNAKPRLRMSLYSPLDIHLYDDAGNHTGPKRTIVDGQEQMVIEEGIPNSYYHQFGERKYVGFGGGEKIRVVMNGYDLGVYTLKLEEIRINETNEEIVSHVVFKNLPATDDTTVSFSMPEAGLSEMTVLDADVDSDGTNDYVVEKNLNGEATQPITIDKIINDIDHLTKLGFIASTETQDFLQVKMSELAHITDMIKKMDEKDNKNPKANQIKLLNKKIDDLVGFIEDKFRETVLSLAKNLLIQNLNSVKL